MTNHDLGYEYICKQPENIKEKELITQAIDLCPSDAIKEDKGL